MMLILRRAFSPLGQGAGNSSETLDAPHHGRLVSDTVTESQSRAIHIPVLVTIIIMIVIYKILTINLN